jgi:pyridoxamine 5'-phosphate oxidase
VSHDPREDLRVDLSELRNQYEATRFDVADVDGDPYVQFRKWYDAVVDAGYVEPWAMVLATVGPATCCCGD